MVDQKITKTDEEKLMDAAAFIINLVNFILYGSVVMFCWNWYITPFGIQTLNFPHAVGLGYAIRWTFHVPVEKNDQKPKENLAKSLKYSAGTILIVIMLWAFHYFV